MGLEFEMLTVWHLPQHIVFTLIKPGNNLLFERLGAFTIMPFSEKWFYFVHYFRLKFDIRCTLKAISICIFRGTKIPAITYQNFATLLSDPLNIRKLAPVPLRIKKEAFPLSFSFSWIRFFNHAWCWILWALLEMFWFDWRSSKIQHCDQVWISTL